METFGTIVLIIIIVIIVKFIYDTYLTNNTEKNFDEYRKRNPIEAAKMERPKTAEEYGDLLEAIDNEYSFKLKHSKENVIPYFIREDGLYRFQDEIISIYGKPVKLTMLIIFKKDTAMMVSGEGFLEIKSSFIEDLATDDSVLSEFDIAKTEYSCINENITIEFKKSDTHSEVYSGTIINNGLILTRHLDIWDYDINARRKKISLQNMRFEFIRQDE